MTALFALRDTGVAYPGPHGAPVTVVRRLALDVAAGECLAVVGASGSGKTQGLLAPFGLAAPGAVVTGEAWFGGQRFTPATARALRGSAVGFVFQDPLATFAPHLTLGTQLAEVATTHRGIGRRQALDEATALLEEVGVDDARQRLRQFPHELSGGQRQRAAVAMALLGNPRLLIADEPTTALDGTVQAQLLALLHRLRATRRLSLLLASHDLGVVAALADRVVVMADGMDVETAPVDTLFSRPAHAYTRALLAAMPALSAPGRRA